MRKTMAGLTAALVLMATPVVAQDRPLGQPADSSRGMGMMQSGMMQGGMMHGMHGQDGMMGMMGMMGPELILRLEESLELTDSQVEQLEALRERARTGMRRHMMQGMMQDGGDHPGRRGGGH